MCESVISGHELRLSPVAAFGIDLLVFALIADLSLLSSFTDTNVKLFIQLTLLTPDISPSEIYILQFKTVFTKL